MEGALLTDVTIGGADGVAMTVPVPAGWWVGDVAGAGAVLMRAAHGAFRTNVVLSCERVPAEADLARIALHTRARLDARYDAVDVRGEVARRAGDAAGFVRVVLFDLGPRATRVAQIQAVFDGGVTGSERMAFTVVATCAADELTELAAELVGIIDGACVRRSPPGE